MCSLVLYKTFFGVELSFFLKVQRSYFRRIARFRKTHEDNGKKGVLVANKQILVGKNFKCTKESTPGNKISKKRNICK